MNKAETAAGAILIGVGAFMLFEAMKMLYMLDAVPGPGFLPRWIAAAIIVTGLVLTLRGIRPGRLVHDVIDWPRAPGWRRVGLMVSALAIALIVLDKLGFLITTTAFMLGVVFGLGSRSWQALVLMPLAAAIGLYVVFAVWLSVPLPKGLLNFFG